jgi:hypothetical protein
MALEREIFSPMETGKLIYTRNPSVHLFVVVSLEHINHGTRPHRSLAQAKRVASGQNLGKRPAITMKKLKHTKKAA